MDSQDSNQFSCSQKTSNNTPPTPFSNHFGPFNLPLQSNYHFGPMNASYLPHVNPGYGTQLSYQDVLNNPSIPVELTQFHIAPKCPKNKSRDAEHPSSSQSSIANKNWSKAEDVTLTKAWLYVSIDSNIGNNQKNTAMWNRILQIWKDNMGTECNNTQNTNSLGCRWAKIQGAVNKFVWNLRVSGKTSSKWNKSRRSREALQMYEDVNNNKPFKFEHYWEIMIKNPKWCSKGLTKTNGSNIQTIDSNISHSLSRNGIASSLHADSTTNTNGCEHFNGDGVLHPPGRKACKEKNRILNDEKGVVDALNKLQSTIEMQVNVNREELELLKEKEKKEFELQQQLIKKEIELKEKSQRLKRKHQKIKETDQKLKIKEQKLMEQAQERLEQDRIMNQDLTKLSPSMRQTYEIYRAQILKEWENDGLFSNKV